MDKKGISAAIAGCFSGVGATFTAISATGLPALFGVGAAFLGLGVLFLVRGWPTRR
jgi:hypothetical protein